MRKKLHGTAARPRVTVYRSHKNIYAQVVDDDAKLERALRAAGCPIALGSDNNNTDMLHVMKTAISLERIQRNDEIPGTLPQPEDMLADVLRKEAEQSADQFGPLAEEQKQIVEKAEKLAADANPPAPVAPLDPEAVRKALEELKAGNLQEAVEQHHLPGGAQADLAVGAADLDCAAGGRAHAADHLGQLPLGAGHPPLQPLGHVGEAAERVLAALLDLPSEMLLGLAEAAAGHAASRPPPNRRWSITTGPATSARCVMLSSARSYSARMT